MKRALGIAMLALAVALPAAAQKVTIDYAHDFDFSKVKTYQYVDSEKDTSPNQLMHDRIVSAITTKINSRGILRQVTENPDLVITYHLASQENTVYNTTSVGYGGYGGYWGGWRGYGGGMASATTYASTYTEGTLIIDAYDAKEKKLVWRGAGTVTVKDNPEKRSQQVDKIVDKLSEKWAKIHAGKAK